MRQGKVLLVLLVTLSAAGAWNYVRNWKAEQEVFRPYRSYSDAELEKLRTAYQQEIDRLSSRQEALERRVRAHKFGAQQAGPLLGDRVAAFERTRQMNDRLRAVEGEIAEFEAAVRDLEAEERRRELERDRVRLFLRRLLTVGPVGS